MEKRLVVNLYKTGDPFNTNNYRGLTINSCLGKVSNSVLNNRITKFLEKNKIINDEQIGFRKNARTSDHIFILNTLVHKYKQQKKCLDLCFVDFRKAYDSVWQKAPVLKLLRNGVKGKMFKIINAMYDGCTAGVKNGNTITKMFDCKTSVRQGYVFSPNLFNLYVNDLPTHLPNRLNNPILGDKECKLLDVCWWLSADF